MQRKHLFTQGKHYKVDEGTNAHHADFSLHRHLSMHQNHTAARLVPHVAKPNPM